MTCRFAPVMGSPLAMKVRPSSERPMVVAVRAIRAAFDATVRTQVFSPLARHLAI